MKINDAGLSLLKRFEGCRLDAYQDQAGVWTVGYGHTGPHVGPGLCIDLAAAEDLLALDLERFEEGVTTLVHGRLTPNEFSALVCLSYNVGLGAFEHSHLLQKLNEGDKDAAADEFLSFNHVDGKVDPGLTVRRVAERRLFKT